MRGRRCRYYGMLVIDQPMAGTSPLRRRTLMTCVQAAGSPSKNSFTMPACYSRLKRLGIISNRGGARTDVAQKQLFPPRFFGYTFFGQCQKVFLTRLEQASSSRIMCRALIAIFAAVCLEECSCDATHRRF